MALLGRSWSALGVLLGCSWGALGVLLGLLWCSWGVLSVFLDQQILARFPFSLTQVYSFAPLGPKICVPGSIGPLGGVILTSFCDPFC